MRIVVREFISFEYQFIGVLGDAFGTDRDGGGVIAVVRSFFEHVILHNERTAVRQFDFVAGGSLRPVHDLIADQFGSDRARLYVMPVASFQKLGVLDVEKRDVPDINAVRAGAFALPIADELAVLDR